MAADINPLANLQLRLSNARSVRVCNAVLVGRNRGDFAIKPTETLKVLVYLCVLLEFDLVAQQLCDVRHRVRVVPNGVAKGEQCVDLTICEQDDEATPHHPVHHLHDALDVKAQSQLKLQHFEFRVENVSHLLGVSVTNIALKQLVDKSGGMRPQLYCQLILHDFARAPTDMGEYPCIAFPPVSSFQSLFATGWCTKPSQCVMKSCSVGRSMCSPRRPTIQPKILTHPIVHIHEGGVWAGKWVGLGVMLMGMHCHRAHAVTS
eukprot:2880804-Prymnesium_polylepis.1